MPRCGRPARRAVSRPVCADETNLALSVDRTLLGTSTIGPHPARPVPAVAPRDPSRSADACRSAIGRAILVRTQPPASERLSEGHVRSSLNPGRATPSLRPHTQTGRHLPSPAAPTASPDIHYYRRIDKPTHKKRRHVSVFALLALVAAGVVLATILLWLLRRALS